MIKIFPVKRHLNEDIYIQNETENTVTFEVSNHIEVINKFTVKPYTLHTYKNNSDLILSFKNSISFEEYQTVFSDGSFRLGNPEYIIAKYLNKSENFLIEFSNKKCIVNITSYYLNLDKYYKFFEIDNVYAILIREGSTSFSKLEDIDLNNKSESLKAVNFNEFYILNTNSSFLWRNEFDFDQWFIVNDSLFISNDNCMFKVDIINNKTRYEKCINYDEILHQDNFNITLLTNECKGVYKLGSKNSFTELKGSIEFKYGRYIVTDAEVLDVETDLVVCHTSNYYLVNVENDVVLYRDKYFKSVRSIDGCPVVEGFESETYNTLFLGLYHLEFKYVKSKVISGSKYYFRYDKLFNNNGINFFRNHFVTKDGVNHFGDIKIPLGDIIRNKNNVQFVNYFSNKSFLFYRTKWEVCGFQDLFNEYEFVEILDVFDNSFYVIVKRILNGNLALECHRVKPTFEGSNWISQFITSLYSVVEFQKNAQFFSDRIKYQGKIFYGELTLYEDNLEVIASDGLSQFISLKDGKYNFSYVSNGQTIHRTISFLDEAKKNSSILFDDKIFTKTSNGYNVFSLDGLQVDQLDFDIVDVTDEGMLLCDSKDLSSLHYRNINLYNYATGGEVNYQAYKNYRFSDKTKDLIVSADVFIELIDVETGRELDDDNIQSVFDKLHRYNCLLLDLKFQFSIINYLCLKFEKIIHYDIKLDDLAFLEIVIDNYFRADSKDVIFEQAFEKCIKIIYSPKIDEKKFYSELIRTFKDDKNESVNRKLKEIVSRIREFIIFQIIDYKRYVKLEQRSNSVDIRIYLNKNLVFYNWSSFSSCSSYLAIVGKPPMYGYIEVIKLRFSNNLLVGYDSFFSSTSPKYAVWRGFFKGNKFLLAHDSTPDLYIVPIASDEQEEYSEFFKRKKLLGSSLYGWSKYSAVSLKRDCEFFALKGHSILAISNSERLVACGHNVYESVKNGGSGHILTSIVRVLDISQFPFKELVRFEDFGVEIMDGVQSQVRNKKNGFTTCSFTKNDDYLFLYTNDKVIHIKKLPKTDSYSLN